MQYVSDSVFNSGTLDAVKSYVKYGNKVYLGSFNYFNDATKDMVELMQPFKEASHSSDFKYYFGSGVMANFTPTDEEMEVMDMSGTLMANFVKYGYVFQFNFFSKKTFNFPAIQTGNREQNRGNRTPFSNRICIIRLTIPLAKCPIISKMDGCAFMMILTKIRRSINKLSMERFRRELLSMREQDNLIFTILVFFVYI